MEIRKGPLGIRILCLNLEELGAIDLDRTRNLGGFIFIDLHGRIHFELNNIRLVPGNPLELLFLPDRYYKKLGRLYAGCSVWKPANLLLGGIRFFYFAREREIRPAGTALIPRDQVPDSSEVARKSAFRDLFGALEQLAKKLQACRGIVSADRVPPEKMIQMGWEVYKPAGLGELLRLRFFYLPGWAKTFYIRHFAP